jgi:hypothetical protein
MKFFIGVCVVFIAICGDAAAIQFVGSVSDADMVRPLRTGTRVSSRPGTDMVLCGTADIMRTPPIFRRPPANCQIVTFGCNCINAISYIITSPNGTITWSVSPMFTNCFVVQMPETRMDVTLTWIAAVRKLEGDLCDRNELVGMFTPAAEGDLLLYLTPYF